MMATRHPCDSVDYQQQINASHYFDDDNLLAANLQNKSKTTSVRYLMCALVFAGMANMYALRANISIAMVAMVTVPPPQQQQHSTSSLADNFTSLSMIATTENSTQTDTNRSASGQFQWSAAMQSAILGSYFYGYLIAHIPGGYLASKFGGHRVVSWSFFICAVLTLFTPAAAGAGPYFLLALRFLLGIVASVTYPSFHTFWSHWAPVGERARLISISYAGSNVGIILTNIMSGWLCDTHGWPVVFYVTGCVGFVWCLVWFLLGANEPQTHRFISNAERQYIVGHITTSKPDSHAKLTAPMPWRRLLCSPPVIAVCWYSFCSAWCQNIFLTELPAFMNNLLRVSLTTSGLLMALPYVALTVTSILSGFAADALLMHTTYSVTSVRKLLAVSAHILPIPFLVLVTSVGCNYVAAETMLIVALATSGLKAGSSNVNTLDLVGKDYIGLLHGLTGTISSLGSSLVPTVAAWTIGEPREQSFAAWNKFFIISSVVIGSSSVLYALIGSGKRLSWLDDYIESKRPLLDEPPQSKLINSQRHFDFLHAPDASTRLLTSDILERHSW